MFLSSPECARRCLASGLPAALTLLLACGGRAAGDAGTGTDAGTDTAPGSDGVADASLPTDAAAEATSPGTPDAPNEDEASPVDAPAPADSLDENDADDASDAIADVGPDTTGCTLPTPVFLPPSGKVVLGNTSIISNASGAPPGLQFFYTSDGTLPTRASTLYTGPIPLFESLTLHAVAVAPDCADSLIGSATYMVFSPPPPDCAIYGPVAFDPPPGMYTGDFDVALSSPNPSEIICYTLDGVTTPVCGATESSCSAGMRYNAGTPIHIDATVRDAQGKATINAVACAACLPSPVVTAVYTQ
jgi:hypothetical protein